MQEKQTVSFQPIGYEGHVPWFVNLFVVYLLYVLLTTVGSAVRVMWSLRKIRKASEREPRIELVVCSAKIRSIQKLLPPNISSRDACSVFQHDRHIVRCLYGQSAKLHICRCRVGPGARTLCNGHPFVPVSFAVACFLRIAIGILRICSIGR